MSRKRTEKKVSVVWWLAVCCVILEPFWFELVWNQNERLQGYNPEISRIFHLDIVGFEWFWMVLIRNGPWKSVFCRLGKCLARSQEMAFWAAEAEGPPALKDQGVTTSKVVGFWRCISNDQFPYYFLIRKWYFSAWWRSTPGWRLLVDSCMPHGLPFPRVGAWTFVSDVFSFLVCEKSSSLIIPMQCHFIEAPRDGFYLVDTCVSHGLPFVLER